MIALFAAAVVACFLFSINYHQLIETAAEAKQTHAEKETQRGRGEERESGRARGRGAAGHPLSVANQFAWRIQIELSVDLLAMIWFWANKKTHLATCPGINKPPPLLPLPLLDMQCPERGGRGSSGEGMSNGAHKSNWISVRKIKSNASLAMFARRIRVRELVKIAKTKIDTLKESKKLLRGEGEGHNLTSEEREEEGR